MDLDFDRTVSKLLVHKWSLDQVLLTGFRPVADGRMLLGAELPRSHGFYCEFPLGDSPPDLAAVVEACRQACFVVAHEQFDVPVTGYQFMFQELDAAFESADFPPAAGRPLDLVLDCTVERRYRRGLVWSFAVSCAGVAVARVRIRMIWIERRRWREMRAVMRRGRDVPATLTIPPAPAGTVPPERVGRVNPANVVLERVGRRPDGSHEAVALIDVRHPVLFDHPIDHVYAMVQLEAARQLSLLAVAESRGRPAADLRLRSCSAAYTSVAEFDLPTVLIAELRARESGGVEVGLWIGQGDRQASRQTLVIEPRG